MPIPLALARVSRRYPGGPDEGRYRRRRCFQDRRIGLTPGLLKAGGPRFLALIDGHSGRAGEAVGHIQKRQGYANLSAPWGVGERPLR
jgi:hypothetical protein